MSTTIYTCFKSTASAHADRPFLCVPARADRDWLPEGVELSYAQVERNVEAWRQRYAEAGYGHGHRVAVLLENRPECLIQLLALNALGIGMVPINGDYRHDEMLYLMEHSEAEIAVVLPSRMATLTAVARDRAQPLPVVNVLEPPEHLPAPSRSAPLSTKTPDLETEAALLYTSGTTGRPKGCILSNLYFLESGGGYLSQGGLLTVRHGEERFYNPLPLFHMNHLALTGTCAILSANCLVLPERFSPTRWWTEVASTRATIVHYLGVVAPMLLNQPETADEKRHQVRFGLGAGVEPQLHAAFEERFGFPLVEVWGMTETGRLFSDNQEPRHRETRAYGRPHARLQAMVVDDDDREVPRGIEGELVVRHSAEQPRRGFFSGYLKNDEATREAWRSDWFHTGDIVRQDESGMLHFVDRKKNIIRRSGENIAAAEVEAVLQAHDKVAQIAVLAVADAMREQEVLACIVPMAGVDGGEALADELFAWANARLAYFKVPGWFLFLDALPTTGTQKIQKQLIFASGEDPLGRSGIIDVRSRKRRGA
jgi:crotonobetaine/carnitine-CoA ligase